MYVLTDTGVKEGPSALKAPTDRILSLSFLDMHELIGRVGRRYLLIHPHIWLVSAGESNGPVPLTNEPPPHRLESGCACVVSD